MIAELDIHGDRLVLALSSSEPTRGGPGSIQAAWGHDRPINALETAQSSVTRSLDFIRDMALSWQNFPRLAGAASTRRRLGSASAH